MPFKTLTDYEPSPDRVITAVSRAVERHRRVNGDAIRWVAAHGSWVRRDFWPGTSDLDFIVIGQRGKVPLGIKSDLKAFELDLGAAVDSWETSENELNSIRASRRNSDEIRECRIVQLDINGFDV